ncbi:MAG: inositol monophosphatase [Oligoflexales bacterium]
MYDISTVLEDVKTWCIEVGAYQVEYFRSNDLEISTKSTDSDLVTKVDKNSEKMILEKINAKYSKSKIIAEESGESGVDSDYTWVIDPLDGTNNYASGLPIFAISIGLYKLGKPVIGVVYAPYLKEMYYASKGNGAYLNGKKLEISTKESLKHCMVGTGFPYDKAYAKLNNLDYFNNLLPKVRGIRRYGACAYDLCLVASACLDAYWEMSLQEWDIAAGALIVEEAGGKVIHFREDRNFSIIAANHQIADTIASEHKQVDLQR